MVRVPILETQMVYLATVIPISTNYFSLFYSLMMATVELDYAMTPCLLNSLRAKWCSKSSNLHETKILSVVSQARAFPGYLM